MRKTASNELVDYHHPLLRYTILNLKVNKDEVWNLWHYHKEIEILLLLEGAMLVETVENVYELHEQNDVLIIGSSRPHRTKRLCPSKLIVFQFDMLAQLDQYTRVYSPVLLELSEPLNRINEIITTNRSIKENMFQILLKIYEEAKQRETGFEIAVSGAIKQLLTLFIRHIPSADTISPTDWQRLKPVLDHIETHYADPIRIQDVLPLVHLEYHYFIKYFQKCIGMSFVGYLHFRRIKKAEHLLLTEPLSIADIGVRSGFPNTTQFIRIFKRYNRCTPSEFRKKRTQI